jgi:hypothetical protein
VVCRTRRHTILGAAPHQPREEGERRARRRSPGPTALVDSTVTFTYIVTNDGNVPLVNVAVTDVP